MPNSDTLSLLSNRRFRSLTSLEKSALMRHSRDVLRASSRTPRNSASSHATQFITRVLAQDNYRDVVGKIADDYKKRDHGRQ
ncbi:MAG: hypothetical protein MK137_01105 [Rickettsiales bacterium]|nr:hypothetical protein [Rickettsiales bacterium]